MNIVLTGFYCSGARETGRELARRLRRPLIDVPMEIKRRQRLSMFRLPGKGPPPSSRTLEEWVIRDLSYRRETVVVLGLDTLAREINREELDVFSFVVFIDPPFPVLWERIRRESSLSDMVLEHGRSGFYEMWLELRGYYEQCQLQLFVQPNAPVHTSKLVSHCFFV